MTLVTYLYLRAHHVCALFKSDGRIHKLGSRKSFTICKRRACFFQLVSQKIGKIIVINGYGFITSRCM